MPDFRAGSSPFRSGRYTVTGLLERDLFWHHAATVDVPALAGGKAGDPLTVELKSIDYERSLPELGETFEQYVDRRRQELRREAELLAVYHDFTAHVPQVVDVIDDFVVWDDRVRAHGKEEGEVCLALEQIQAEPLVRLREPLSQDEALDLVEKLLMVLRVFHGKEPATGAQRYFFTLFPDDVLIDRRARDCWLTNLWKLRTVKDLSAGPLWCDPNRQAFVSPSLAAFLRPAPARPVPFNRSPGQTAADSDLYSVGVVLYHLLDGGPDLSTQLPGFLTVAEIQRLKGAIGLSTPVAEFLRRLAEHDYHSAQKALDDLCRIRGHSPPEFLFLEAPPKPKSTPTVPHLADGAWVGGRYRVERFLAQGGLGCVYLGKDQRTGATVVLKTVLYDPDARVDEGKSYCMKRREEQVEEARLTIRLHSRTGAIPQLLDVVLDEAADPTLAGDPDLGGATDPVLVLEFIPGVSLWREYCSERVFTELELLRLLRNICGIAGRFHQPDKSQNYYLYVDWKPDNIVRHRESGNVTIVDLGAAVPVVNQRWQGRVFASTAPYSAPEERLPGQAGWNRNLRPTFDVHGIAAVLWVLAVRPEFAELEAMSEAVESGQAQYPLLDASRISKTDYPSLRSILARGLEVDPARRYQSVEEMAKAALQAMGRMCPLPPERPRHFLAQPESNGAVKLTCRRPADPLCRQIVISREVGRAPIHKTDVVVDADVSDRDPGDTMTWEDGTLDDKWTEAHYSAVSIGYNGQPSAAIRCAVQRLVDPLVRPPARGERQLTLRWEVPEIVRRNNGVVIVERITDGPEEIYSGLGTEVVDGQLDPARRYCYRLYSRMSYGSSSGVEVEASPLPTLARLAGIRAEGGDHQVCLRFRLPPAAVDEILLFRTQKPFDAAERAELLRHAQSGRIPAGLQRFSLGVELDKEFRAVAVTPNPATTSERSPDGSLDVAWIDSTARPGQQYWYTPLMTYREGNCRWFAVAVAAAAFAEAAQLESEPLPGGVRLRWSLREPADELDLVRKHPGGADRALGPLQAEHTEWLDRGLPAREPVTYRLRLRTGKTWSAGRETTCAPAETPEVLPRLWVAPAERSLHLRYPASGSDGGAPRIELVSQSGAQPVTARDGEPGEWHGQTLDSPAGCAVQVRLLNAGGNVLGCADATPFSEVRSVRVVGNGDGIDVTWDAPDGCETVLVTLCGTTYRRAMPASRRRCRISPAPLGANRVLVQTLTRLGDVSPGVLGALTMDAGRAAREGAVT